MQKLMGDNNNNKSAITTEDIVKLTDNGCRCGICIEYHEKKLIEVGNCKCHCHINGFAGHDGLCCPFPNVLHILLPEYKKQYDKEKNKI